MFALVVFIVFSIGLQKVCFCEYDRSLGCDQNIDTTATLQ